MLDAQPGDIPARASIQPDLTRRVKELEDTLRHKDEVELPALRREKDLAESQLRALSRAGLQEGHSLGSDRAGLVRVDRRGAVLSLNRFAESVLGVRLDEVVGKPLRDLGRGSARGKPLFHEAVALLAEGAATGEWEREFVSQRGETMQLRLLMRREGGMADILFEDLTAQRVLESRFKAIMGASRDGIVVVDEAGVISWPNSRFGWFFGINWRQFSGLSFKVAADLVGNYFDDPSAFATFVRHIELNPDEHAEITLELAMPTQRTLQIFTRPIINDAGHPIGRVWFFTDVTSFKNLENRLKAINLELEDRVRDRTLELSRQFKELAQARNRLEKANRELESELDMAKQVQQGILPRELPELPGYQLSAAYAPTGKVGGDFYDTVLLNERELFLLMADVSGHGVPAALVTAMAKMAFSRYVAPGKPINDILAAVNLELCTAIRTDHYLTVFAAVLDLPTGRMRFSRVCHPYPVIARADGALERITQRGGMFVGMFDDSAYEEDSLVLEHGDLLFVYTDGLHESLDPEDRQFGRARLEETVLAGAPGGARNTVILSLTEQERFCRGRPPNDDITVLAVSRL